MIFQQKKQQAKNEQSLAMHIPYSSLVEEDTVMLKDGSLLACFYIEGVAFETKSYEEVSQASGLINQYLTSLEDDRITVHIHRIRRPFKDELKPSDSGNWFADKFSRDYNAFTSGNVMMATEIYISILLGEEKQVEGFFKRKIATAESEAVHLKERLTNFRYQCTQLEAIFSDYNIQRLTSYEDVDTEGRTIYCSAQLTFLNFLMSGVWTKIQIPLGPLHQALGTSQVFVGRDIIQFVEPNGTRYAQSLEFKELPETVSSGLLDGLLYPGNNDKDPYPFIESQYFKIILRKSAVKIIETQIGKLASAGDKADNQRAELTDAQAQIQSGQLCLGNFGYSLLVFGPTETECRKNLQDSYAKFIQSGFTPFISTLTAGPSFLSTLPGNQKWTPRPIRITSLNFSDFAPFHNFLPGKRDHNPWGQAIGLLIQPSLQPYYLNLHATNRFENSYGEPDAGSTVIFGETGAGKTALLSFMATMSMKYADASHKFSMVFFDLNRGAQILVNALDGTYIDSRNGRRTGFNPFQLPPTPDNMNFLNEFLRLLLRSSGQPVTAIDEIKLDEALKSVMSMEKPMRRLSTLMQNLTDGNKAEERENSIRKRMEKWFDKGNYAWVFDNPTDEIDLESKRVIGIDGTDFLDNSVTATPVAFYLLHRVKQIIDGRRAIIFMDEFWKWVKDEAFRSFAESELKTIRKKNAIMVFATQSPSDVLNNPIARTVVEQTSTQIMLPNRLGDRKEYVEFFKATEREYEIIKNLHPKSRHFLIKQLGSSSLVKLNLASFKDEMTVFSSTYRNIELMEDIRSQLKAMGAPDSPDVWLPLFYEAVRKEKEERKLSLAQEEKSHR